MTAGQKDIEVPALRLKACSVDEHARALVEIGRLPFWWYQGTSRIFGNFSLPFRDARGRWWYQVKPGLCWAVDCFQPVPPEEVCMPPLKACLGFQHVVGDEKDANSRLVINAILDLPSYGPESLLAKRRNVIRKGIQNLDLSALASGDDATVEGCRRAWNDLSARTGWKHTLGERDFHRSWELLLACPGVSVIVARDRGSGEVAGFLITKIIGDTAYVDTMASRSDLLSLHINDATMFTFLMTSRALPGVTKAHCAIKSYVEPLEKFKTGLGFQPHPFPVHTRLRAGLAGAMKVFFPKQYNRMTGKI